MEPKREPRGRNNRERRRSKKRQSEKENERELCIFGSMQCMEIAHLC